MDLETLFHVVAIIFMLTILFFFLGLGIVIFYLRRKIAQLVKLASRPADAVVDIGTEVANSALKRVKAFVDDSSGRRKSRGR